MKKVNVYELPITVNICDQMLREVARTPAWSIAHVLMNPKSHSRLHEHRMMREAYIITKGSGRLVRGDTNLLVQAGDVVCIQPLERHRLINTGVMSLEHFVLASPLFDPEDVYLDTMWQDPQSAISFRQLEACGMPWNKNPFFWI